MTNPESPSSPITLFGATGYTGQLIAQALSRAGLPFRIAGRSAEKLSWLSAELPGRPAWFTADVTRSSSTAALFQDTSLLINCAGPFTDLGERVISQAALAGVHYLDITNELGYVIRARGFNDLAQKTAAALVPSCGFEVALSDCAAQLVATSLAEKNHPEPIDEINVVYKLDWTGASSGTRRSAIRSLATSWVAYRDGGWDGQIPGGKVRSFALPGGKRYTLSFPSSESVTVPAHLPVRQVNAWMTTARGVRVWGPLIVPLLSRLSRSVLRGLILTIAALGGRSPSASAGDEARRKRSRFTILIEARAGKETRSALLTGSDPYGLTAEIITYAARQLTLPGYAEKGFLAPSQALDPRALIDYAQENWGITFLEHPR